MELFDNIFKQTSAMDSLMMSDYYPIFLKVVQRSTSTPVEVKVALCVMCGIVDFSTISISQPLLAEMMQHFSSNILAKDGDVQQSACYGVGTIAKKVGSFFSPYLQVTATLKKACTLAQNEHAQCNAKSALVKVIMYQSPSDMYDMTAFILKQLPTSGDANEAQLIYRNIFTMAKE